MMTQLRERLTAPGRWQFTRTRRYAARFSSAGLTTALIFYCLSLTPSLLPRAWYLQAVMSGVTTVIGYAVGALIGWLLRSLIRWHPGPAVRRGGWWALAVAAVVLIPLFSVLGAQWQDQIRELVEASGQAGASYVLVALLSILIAAGLLAAGRGVRWLVRLIARLLGRVIPTQAAIAAAVLIVILVLGFIATGVLPRVAHAAADSVFSGIDHGTSAGITQPASPLRSGSPDSLAPWVTLGRQGRTFVASGPAKAEIGAFTGSAAMEPIRVYIGLESASSIAAESALAVRELERTGAFNRKVLVVATTTGTGWLNPSMIDPLEYMWGGDTAIAAIQYSYLPSWLSFIFDQGPAQEAGRDLFDAVYASGAGCRPATGPRSRSSARASARSAARPPSAAPRTSATGRRPCSGSGRPTAIPCGAGSRPTGARAARSGSRCTSSAGRSASARPDPIRPPPAGTGRGSSTCRTPPTRSCGGRGAWPSTSPTGCAAPTRRTSRRPCTGTRW